IEPAELEYLLSVPSKEWVDGDGDRSRRLVELGLLVSDEDEPAAAELRRRDERLAAGGWNAYAAVYHFLTRWREVDLRGGGEGELPLITRETVERFVELRGLPPPAFEPSAAPLQELSLDRPDRELYTLLRRRRTTRSFDGASPLPQAAFATALDTVFGCHGHARVIDGITLLKRTSPSGGALQPIDAYPVVRDVEGVAPGIYRYDALRHALEPLAPLDPEDPARFVVGQTYFAEAHALVVLAGRFGRSHWKYRHHQKAYAALLLDAGHLSQTLYLVATELGLGAFVTAAINAALIDERLGLDGYGHTPASALAHGDERRLGVARALATEPSFVLLDEPAAGLPEAEVPDFAALVRSIASEHGAGVLLIDHNMALIMETCDRIQVLDQGTVLAEGTPVEIRANVDVAAAYLGATPVPEEG
ncbi:MAG TPA: putative peptide maturation dehydrogenase, partial [Gaiellaceae bacterium]